MTLRITLKSAFAAAMMLAAAGLTTQARHAETIGPSKTGKSVENFDPVA